MRTVIVCLNAPKGALSFLNAFCFWRRLIKKIIAILLCVLTVYCLVGASACGAKEPTIIDITPSYSPTESPVTFSQESVLNTQSSQGENSVSAQDDFDNSSIVQDTQDSAETEFSSQQSFSDSSNQGDDFDESLCLIIIVEQDAESQSLLNYMIAKGYDFTADGTGFVTSINGRANKSPYYWMLYTDDKKNTTSSWGAVKYHGTVYYSASKGAKTLMVKPGCTYIWYYTKTNY